MPKYLGLDTSNYTTSTALFDSDTGIVKNVKKLLPVKSGELGIRQSDAVFHHTKQLPELLNDLMQDVNGDIKAVGVSTRPRNAEGSYMPCFLVGETCADALSSVSKIEAYKTSHQVGHILAALFSCARLDLIMDKKPFIAFHVSGGTTDCLYVEPDDGEIIKVKMIGSSLDLKAGQAIDRVGLMLGLDFPCGAELEKLAERSDYKCNIKPTVREGNCSLSGLENKCQKLLSDGSDPCDIARFCILNIKATIRLMAKYALTAYGEMPIIFAGGVMSNKIIRASLEKEFDAYFAEPVLSCDNACGTAIYAAIKDGYLR